MDLAALLPGVKRCGAIWSWGTDMAVASTDEMPVNSYVDSDQASPRIAVLKNGGWLVTWESVGQDGDGPGIYQQIYSSTGQPFGSEKNVNSTVEYSQFGQQVVALQGGGWVVVWQNQSQNSDGIDIHQQVFDAGGAARGPQTCVNTHMPKNQTFPQALALPDGGWVVVWQSYDQDGSRSGIYQQVFHADGKPNGVETQLNTTTLGDQSDPRIALLAGGGWVVTWQSENHDGSGLGICQRAFDADGNIISDMGVNTTTAGHQTGAQVAALPEGGWVVTWQSPGASGLDIFQRVFDADGTPRGPEIRVSSHDAGDQTRPLVAVLAGGGWVVTWQSEGQDAEFGLGLYQQVFDEDGNAVGGERQVNTRTAHDQSDHQITALSDGGWVVTWTSFYQDEDLGGVYQQAFNASGEPEGEEIRVNVHTTGNQTLPQIKALAGGAWVVAWESVDQDGSGKGIFQRVFWVDHAPVAKTVAQRTATEDKAFSFTVAADTFSDPDRYDTLVWSARLANGEALPGWLKFNSSTRTFSGTPLNGDTGSFSLRLTATDRNGNTAETTFALVVANVNDRPTLPANSTAVTYENAPLALNVLSRARDEDGDVLKVTSASIRSGFGAVVVGKDGRLLYDPTVAANQNIDAGETRTVVIRYTVSDGKGGMATADVTVTVKGIAPDLFKGAAGQDVLRGSKHGDLLYGYAGHDTLDGGTGADRMYGGTGNDTYVVDNAKDLTIEKANEGTDLVRAAVSWTLAANVEHLTLSGTARLNGTGNTLANRIVGNSGNNVLNGQAGNDTLTGGRGADDLYGGSGKDVFVFLSSADSTLASSGRDTIFDFTKGDRIDLRTIDANRKAVGEQAFTFIAEQKFHKKPGELRYDKKTSDTYIYGDTNGDGLADFAIHLDDRVTLAKGDFLL